MPKVEVKIDGASMWAKEIKSKVDFLVDGKVAYSLDCQHISPVTSFPQGAFILDYSYKDNKKFIVMDSGGKITYKDSVVIGFDPSISPNAKRAEYFIKSKKPIKIIRKEFNRHFGFVSEVTIQETTSYTDFIPDADLQKKYYVYEVSNLEKEDESVIVTYVNLY